MKKLVLATLLALAAVSGVAVVYAPPAYANCGGKHGGA